MDKQAREKWNIYQPLFFFLPLPLGERGRVRVKGKRIMEYLSAGLLILVIALLFWMALNLKQRGKSEEQTQALLMLQKETESLRNEFSNSMSNHVSLINQQLGQTASQVNEQLKSVTLQLQSSTGQLNQRMDNAAKVVGDVGRSLGQLSEATKQVYEVGKDIASLQEILKSPKLRGGLGEVLPRRPPEPDTSLCQL